MVVLLPGVFRFFARVIAPFAPKTEFTFLLITALVCSYITRQLGAYYLVGAFVVGLAAVQLQKTLPELTSHKLIGAMELFAGFFIPFYFFKAGLHLERENFSLDALGLGVVLVLIAVPLKIVSVVAHRRIAVAEPLRSSLRIGLAIVPTLVFTLVLADILRTQYALDARLFGALMIYTFVNTAIPGFILRVAPPEVGAGLLDDAVAPPAT